MPLLMSFLRWIARIIRLQESLDIERSTSDSLVVRYRGKVTQFVAKSRTVVQYNRQVASFATIQKVVLREVTDEDISRVWSVDLLLANGQTINIGRETDDSSA